MRRHRTSMNLPKDGERLPAASFSTTKSMYQPGGPRSEVGAVTYNGCVVG